MAPQTELTIGMIISTFIWTVGEEVGAIQVCLSMVGTLIDYDLVIGLMTRDETGSYLCVLLKGFAEHTFYSSRRNGLLNHIVQCNFLCWLKIWKF